MTQEEQKIARVPSCRGALSDDVLLQDGKAELLLPFLWNWDGTEDATPFLCTVVAFATI